MNLQRPKYYHEEIWNTISHAVGLILVLIGGVILVWTTCTALGVSDIVAISIYVAGALFVYASSTAYHAVSPGNLKERLQQVDHISIYFMIAGTHTPVIIRYFNNWEGYIFLAVMWSLVLIGTIFKIFWMGRFEVLSLLLYIGMGTMSLALGPQMLELISPEILAYLIIGGVLYLVGVVFYCWENLPYNHPIWHLFVIAGSVVHFLAIYFIISAA